MIGSMYRIRTCFQFLPWIFALEEEALDFVASVVYMLNYVKVRYIVCNEERIDLEKTKSIAILFAKKCDVIAHFLS